MTVGKGKVIKLQLSQYTRMLPEVKDERWLTFVLCGRTRVSQRFVRNRNSSIILQEAPTLPDKFQFIVESKQYSLIAGAISHHTDQGEAL